MHGNLCSIRGFSESNDNPSTDEISQWLKHIKLEQYRSVIAKMDFQTLKDICGVSGEEFKSFLKKEFAKPDANFGFELKGGHLGAFGSAVEELRAIQEIAKRL